MATQTKVRTRVGVVLPPKAYSTDCLSKLQALKADITRQDYNWGSAQSGPSATYTWGTLDTTFNRTASRAKDNLCCLTYFPKWARMSGPDPHWVQGSSTLSPPDISDFPHAVIATNMVNKYGDFVAAFIKRYGIDIYNKTPDPNIAAGARPCRYFEILNEPSWQTFAYPNPSPDRYALIVEAVWTSYLAMVAALPGGVLPAGYVPEIMIGSVTFAGGTSGTILDAKKDKYIMPDGKTVATGASYAAGTGEFLYKAYAGHTWFDKILGSTSPATNIKNKFTAISVHPYGWSGNDGTLAHNANYHTGLSGCLATLVTFGADKNPLTATDKKMHITETGVPTDGTGALDGVTGGPNDAKTQTVQAQFITDLITNFPLDYGYKAGVITVFCLDNWLAYGSPIGSNGTQAVKLVDSYYGCLGVSSGAGTAAILPSYNSYQALGDTLETLPQEDPTGGGGGGDLSIETIEFAPGSALLPDGSAGNTPAVRKKRKSSGTPGTGSPTFFRESLHFPPSVDSFAEFTWGIPQDWHDGFDLIMKWGALVNTGNVIWKHGQKSITAGTDVTNTTAFPAATVEAAITVPTTAGFVRSTTFAQDQTGMAGGKTCTFFIGRNGAAAGDTCLGQAFLDFVIVQYNTV